MRSKTALTLEDAQKSMTAAKAEAVKQKWGVTIAVVDDAGLLLMLERMDGARLPHVRGRAFRWAFRNGRAASFRGKCLHAAFSSSGPSAPGRYCCRER